MCAVNSEEPCAPRVRGDTFAELSRPAPEVENSPGTERPCPTDNGLELSTGERSVLHHVEALSCATEIAERGAAGALHETPLEVVFLHRGFQVAATTPRRQQTTPGAPAEKTGAPACVGKFDSIVDVGAEIRRHRRGDLSRWSQPTPTHQVLGGEKEITNQWGDW